VETLIHLTEEEDSPSPPTLKTKVEALMRLTEGEEEEEASPQTIRKVETLIYLTEGEEEEEDAASPSPQTPE
jgi:hypothetical protein